MRNSQSAFVLENAKGEVVRRLEWTTADLYCVFLHKSRRIEMVSSTEELDKEGMAFTLLQQIKRSDASKHPVSLGKNGTLRLQTEDDLYKIDPLPPKEDDNKNFILALKWSGSVLGTLLLLTLVIGHFLLSREKEEERIVDIIQPPEIKALEREIPPPPPEPVKKMVVKPSEKDHVVPRQARTVTPRPAQKVTTKDMALNQMGALGVLGSLTKSNQKGGLNLNATKNGRGIGLGGNEGSGGMQKSLYAKGLMSAPLGEGQRANGAGGYGTRGKGGGQAGYGQLSMVGSSGAYFQPVESEALVEGGLDRNQIAAVIQRHSGEVRYCYEQGLQQKPNLNGRVSVKFLIGGNGSVTTASIGNSSLHSVVVENCILNRLKGWAFPRPRGGVNVKVSYPFALRRVSEG